MDHRPPRTGRSRPTDIGTVRNVQLLVSRCHRAATCWPRSTPTWPTSPGVLSIHPTRSRTPLAARQGGRRPAHLRRREPKEGQDDVRPSQRDHDRVERPRVTLQTLAHRAVGVLNFTNIYQPAQSPSPASSPRSTSTPHPSAAQSRPPPPPGVEAVLGSCNAIPGAHHQETASQPHRWRQSRSSDGRPPNEITQRGPAQSAPATRSPPANTAPPALPAEAPPATPTDPNAGLEGMMIPAGSP